MSNDKKGIKTLKLSPRIKEIFSLKHHIPRDLKLSASNLQNLNQIASEEALNVSRGDRIKALWILARKGGVDECKTIGKVLCNKKENPLIRAAAATNIALCPAKDAEKQLIGNLSISDDIVLSKTVKSLGAIGSKKALNALGKITAVKIPLVKRQIAFAKTLISYRLGLDKNTLKFVSGPKRQIDKMPKNEVFPLQINKAGSKEISDCLQLMEGSNYRVNVSDSLGFKINCGRSQYFLLFEKNWTDNNYLSLLTQRKYLAGLLALKSEESGTYSVQSMILTSPRTPETLDIMVCRTDGELLYSGQGQIKRGAMDFSITDIERIGSVPLKIAGMLAEKTTEFRESWATKRRKSKLSTTALKLRR